MIAGRLINSSVLAVKPSTAIPEEKIANKKAEIAPVCRLNSLLPNAPIAITVSEL